jgi:hypothetical protein
MGPFQTRREDEPWRFFAILFGTTFRFSASFYAIPAPIATQQRMAGAFFDPHARGLPYSMQGARARVLVADPLI